MYVSFQWSALEMAAVLPARECELEVTISGGSQATSNSLPTRRKPADDAICPGILPQNHALNASSASHSPSASLSLCPCMDGAQYPLAALWHRSAAPMGSTTRLPRACFSLPLHFHLGFFYHQNTWQPFRLTYQEYLSTSKIESPQRMKTKATRGLFKRAAMWNPD